MASVKVKFRPSTIGGKEGTIYYQVIHNRVVRQIYTDYKLFASEWDCHSEAVILYHVPNEQERNNKFTYQMGHGQVEQDYTDLITIRYIRDG